MMDAKELGQQAVYPQSETIGNGGEYETRHRGGLTKREAFAMAAMQVLVVPDNYSTHDIRYRKPQRDAETAAVISLRYADALLAELAKDAP